MGLETMRKEGTDSQERVDRVSMPTDVAHASRPEKGEIFLTGEGESGYLLPRRAGRMALTSGLAEDFRTDQAMTRRIQEPERPLSPIGVGPEYYLG